VLFWLIVLGIAKLAAAAVLAVRLFRTGFTGLWGGVAVAVGALAILSLFFTAQNFAQVDQEPEPVLVADLFPGERLYAENCLACHQADGQGIPGAFPPLAGHLPLVAQNESGREYVIGVLLSGLRGEITVFGTTYRGIMPSYAQLKDHEIADVLNYALNAWGNNELLADGFAAIHADEVAAARQRNLSHDALLALRAGFVLPDAPPSAREQLRALAAELAPPVAEVAPQPVVEAPPPAEKFDWQALGGRVYAANCLACHQANGQGIPGAFPPLAGHAPELYHAPGGREYLIKSVLYGLMGPITVAGVSYNGVMPAFPQLSDADIAAVLNYTLTEWGNDALLVDFSPLMPEEVAAERGRNLTMQQVHELRQALGLD
jgi:mono/diheme cytochrome c family protein